MVIEETYPYFKCFIYIRSQFQEKIQKFRSRNFGLTCYPAIPVAICQAAARQSEIFTEFPLKDSFNLRDSIWCFLSNVERFQKFCSFARWRNIRAWAYYEIGMRLKNLRLHRQLEIFIELRPTASFKFNEKKRCIFRIAKRFYKLLWICCGWIRLPVKVSIK